MTDEEAWAIMESIVSIRLTNNERKALFIMLDHDSDKLYDFTAGMIMAFDPQFFTDMLPKELK